MCLVCLILEHQPFFSNFMALVILIDYIVRPGIGIGWGAAHIDLRSRSS